MTERPIRMLSDADIAEVFRQAAEIFPCDVPEHDRLIEERDAAIRRAADVSAALTALVAAGDAWENGKDSYELDAANNAIIAATEQARAALRSQESQKPPGRLPEQP